MFTKRNPQRVRANVKKVSSWHCEQSELDVERRLHQGHRSLSSLVENPQQVKDLKLVNHSWFGFSIGRTMTFRWEESIECTSFRGTHCTSPGRLIRPSTLSVGPTTRLTTESKASTGYRTGRSLLLAWFSAHSVPWSKASQSINRLRSTERGKKEVWSNRPSTTKSSRQ